MPKIVAAARSSDDVVAKEAWVVTARSDEGEPVQCHSAQLGGGPFKTKVIVRGEHPQALIPNTATGESMQKDLVSPKFGGVEKRRALVENHLLARVQKLADVFVIRIHLQEGLDPGEEGLDALIPEPDPTTPSMQACTV